MPSLLVDPDNSFVDVNPAQLVLPRHRWTEWAAGNQKTTAGPSAVSKVVSRDLQAKAWTVQEFISNTRFEMQEVQDLIFEWETSTSYDVACKWIRGNRDRWSAWKPVATSCLEGWGLVDSSGHYVSVRADAVACEPCPAGTTSVRAVDATGEFFQCRPCESGHFQLGTGATTCEPCPKGSAPTAGRTRCFPVAVEAEVSGCMSLEISDPAFVDSTEAEDALKETWRRPVGSNVASPLAKRLAR